MKVLLIGWDAADRSTIRLLIERGLMPHLQHLLSRGISGELTPVRPFDSTALWTSVLTGKRAMSHGVLSAVEADSSHTCIRPTLRWSRTAPALWSILTAAGLRAHSVGWPASHPAEPTRGVSVSNLFVENGNENSVHPAQLFDTLRALRLAPRDVDAASLMSLVPWAAELTTDGDRRLYQVARFVASTASFHAAATWALEHEPWDFAAVRYAGLANLVQQFGAVYLAAEVGRHDKDADLFGNLIPNAYHFFDMLLGRLLELAGPDTSVMLVSEQGWARQRSLAESPLARPEPGILIAAGPAFDSDVQPPAASVCDIAPTIIRAFGLVAQPGTHGRAMTDILRTAAIAIAPTDRSDDQRDGVEDEILDARNSEPLCSLPDEGSVSDRLSPSDRVAPNRQLRHAIKQLNLRRQWRLAEAWIDFQQYRQAAKILERLIHTEPSSIRFRSALAEAYFRTGEYDACRRIILAMQADGISTPLSETCLAAMEVRQGNVAEAREHLRRAEAIDGASAIMLEMMGRLYLRLRRLADARRLLDAAIALDPTLATAHDGMAIVCLLGGDPFGAERQAREAVQLNPQNYDAQYHLGLALTHQNRTDDAIDTFKVAVTLDREGGPSAHRRIADLLQHCGNDAFALHHRALSGRRDRITRRPWLDDNWWCEDDVD